MRLRGTAIRRIKNKDLTVWFLSQRVLPPIATVVPFFLVMRTLGLLDTHLALILINATFILPFVVVILRQTFVELPYELEEAAMVDGATFFQAFRKVALPLALPSVVATGLIIFAFAWNEFLFAITISSQRGDHDSRAHGGARWIHGGCNSGSWQVRALIAMVPPVVIALLAQRYIVRGLTLGAVKG